MDLSDRDAEFIARARTRWPAALAEIERLQRENRILRLGARWSPGQRGDVDSQDVQLLQAELDQTKLQLAFLSLSPKVTEILIDEPAEIERQMELDRLRAFIAESRREHFGDCPFTMNDTWRRACETSMRHVHETRNARQDPRAANFEPIVWRCTCGADEYNVRVDAILGGR
jgi:hypothetical protein